MKRTSNKRIIPFMGLLMFLLFNASIIFADIICGENIEKAEINNFRMIGGIMEKCYNNGELNKVICLYKKLCTDFADKVDERKGKPGKEKRRFKKVTKEVRGNIYQWVALSYIALDEPELAEVYLRKLFIIRRKEKFDDSWLSIKAANRKYYVAPRWLVGFKTGPNFTLAHPVNRFQVLESPAGIEGNSFNKDYKFDFNHSRGMQLGIIVEYALKKKFSVSIRPTVLNLKFQYKNSYEWKGDNKSENITANLTHNQVLNCIEIPVLLRYGFIKSKLKVYIQIGGFYRILISAHKSIDLSITQSDVETSQEAGFSLNKLFTRSNIGFLVGSAVGYDIGRIRLEVEINFKYAFNNIVNRDQRYENDELMLGYYDVFDDTKIRNWELSLNLLLPISFKAFRR